MSGPGSRGWEWTVTVTGRPVRRDEPGVVGSDHAARSARSSSTPPITSCTAVEGRTPGGHRGPVAGRSGRAPPHTTALQPLSGSADPARLNRPGRTGVRVGVLLVEAGAALLLAAAVGGLAHGAVVGEAGAQGTGHGAHRA